MRPDSDPDDEQATAIKGRATGSQTPVITTALPLGWEGAADVPTATEMKEVQVNDAPMLSVLRVAGRRVIIVLTILNIELAGDFLGLAGLLRTVVQNGPGWLSATIDFFMLKGVLAFTTFLLGMIVADWAIRYDERVRGHYGRVPASWLVLNVLLTRWSVRHRRTRPSRRRPPGADEGELPAHSSRFRASATTDHGPERRGRNGRDAALPRCARLVHPD